jgi:hypothetical protein
MNCSLCSFAETFSSCVQILEVNFRVPSAIGVDLPKVIMDDGVARGTVDQQTLAYMRQHAEDNW